MDKLVSKSISEEGAFECVLNDEMRPAKQKSGRKTFQLEGTRKALRQGCLRKRKPANVSEMSKMEG